MTQLSTVDRQGGVTAPAGFRAAGVAAGIKPPGVLDLALVVNDGPLDVAAAVFTTNKVKAAPVLWSRQAVSDGRLRAVVLNSGGANACTGAEGFQDTHTTAEKTAAALGVSAADVAVCSTGLIGERLPMAAVLSGVDGAAGRLTATRQAGTDAATAVLTTDSRPKQSALAHPGGWSVGGFAKGAGMLAPNMATMLSVITTDAVVDSALADATLRAAVGFTYQRLDVDGSTSTNDTVLLLASGASGVTPTPTEFAAVLVNVCDDLARQLQADAEGVTKEVGVTVRGAATEREAETVARAVARDSLVKTAFFGSDPNWGRIVMAVGNADALVDPDRLDVTVNGVLLCEGGVRAADRSRADLSGPQIDVVINLNVGPAEATVLTTDLSHGYVEENSAYSS
ncbi:MAG: bifunctional glutamate N-acetyltransferase/amino-acid acetyltransferase ArgJ [Kutzneria sp.]|nr:bifunctional glutamate N-acetyltransferase/amino-acid acetyltransferase ArgJ [Kutzneria sp.]